MKNSRLYILEESYRLFLRHNVEKVTISELEKGTKKIRGSIFYHFKDKPTLFNCIVNEIFLPQLDIPVRMYQIASNDSFAAFFKSYKSPEERAIEIIRERYHIPDAEKCYFNFLSQAYKYSCGFQEQYTQVFSKEMNMWKIVINRHGKTNRVNCDPHLLVTITMLLKTGILYGKGHPNIPEMDYDNILTEFYDYFIK